MHEYYILAMVAVFVVYALIKRQFFPILLAFILLLVVSFVSITIFGFMPNYSNGTRAGVVQKYSVKGVAIKSGEITMVLPVDGMVMNANDPINLFIVSCLYSKTPEACKLIEGAVASRKKIVVEYNEWLKKPISQDSEYTVKSARPVEEQ